MTRGTSSQRETFRLRIAAKERELFEWAATAQGKKLEDFIVDEALKATHEQVHDQTPG